MSNGGLCLTCVHAKEMVGEAEGMVYCRMKRAILLPDPETCDQYRRKEASDR